MLDTLINWLTVSRCFRLADSFIAVLALALWLMVLGHQNVALVMALLGAGGGCFFLAMVAICKK